ncbi:MAG: TIGR04076 family protein [Chloroflexi bacterium]|nr:TIGR04076 family protein [Chloroflexota bacterium]
MSVKITALKTASNQDHTGKNHQGQILCPYFSEGQEFIIDTHPGEGFCNWAWKDISKACTTLMSEETYPGTKDENTIIARCRDIIRPVFFKLERIEN